MYRKNPQDYKSRILLVSKTQFKPASNRRRTKKALVKARDANIAKISHAQRFSSLSDLFCPHCLHLQSTAVRQSCHEIREVRILRLQLSMRCGVRLK